MYTNIDTDHGLDTIEKWLELHRKDILAEHASFPFALIMELLRIVMKYNIFQFDDCWFHLQNGTAMGTYIACIYATIYYSYHKEAHPSSTTANSSTTYWRFGYPLPTQHPNPQTLLGSNSKQTSPLVYLNGRPKI
jgi:hypothetical protein